MTNKFDSDSFIKYLSGEGIVGIAEISSQNYNIITSSGKLRSTKVDNKEYYELYIDAIDSAQAYEFRIDYLRVDNIKSIHELAGKKLRVDPSFKRGKTDTVGSDPVTLHETSGWFLGDDDEFCWYFRKLSVDFHYVEENKFIVLATCTLENYEDLDLVTEGSAQFIVSIEEEIIHREVTTHKDLDDLFLKALSVYQAIVLKEKPTQIENLQGELINQAIQCIREEVLVKADPTRNDLVVANKVIDEIQLAMLEHVKDFIKIYAIIDVLYNDVLSMPPGCKHYSWLVSLRNVLCDYFMTSENTKSEFVEKVRIYKQKVSH